MSGGIAGRGRPGTRGPAGPMGPTGPQGPAAFSLAIGEVTAVEYGGTPSVVNVGTDQDQIWNMALPTGATGVLTGDQPPTGADGTSLGQLYYCSTNQTYYSLVELNENDNKWRPFMTQESAVTTKAVDVLTKQRGVNANAAGKAIVVFDDVRQQISISLQLSPSAATAPVGQSITFAISQRVYAELQALAEQRGVHSLPIPANLRENGVDTSTTFNLIGNPRHQIGDHNAAVMPHLHTWIPPISGDGENPGVAAVFDDGELKFIRNETSPGAATAYGNVSYPDTQAADDLIHPIFVLSATDYPKELWTEAAAVIPYA